MFLSELKDNQKEHFLDVAIHLSMVDGDYADEEKHTIKQMCRELGIKERLDPVNDYEEALNGLIEDATTREKRIMLIEIAGIVMSDGVYADAEKEEMKKISKIVGIDYSKCEEIINIVKELFVVYSKIGTFLSNKE